MSFTFRSTTVLDFGPQGAGPAGQKDRWRLWLLWPALEFRVLAPRSVDTELNIFERGVLGLCRAGVSSAPEVAALIGFDVELAARVLHDLRLKRLLDAYGVPTDQGVQALDGADVAAQGNYEVGYVYRDPQSGSLFPRVLSTHDRDNALVNAEVDDQGWLTIPQGSVGNRKQVRPFAVAPESLVQGPPSADDILDASIYHARALKNHQKDLARDRNAERTLSEAERQNDVERRQQAVRRVDLVDDAPRLVWLYTYAHHAPDAPSTADAWTVADPFGLGDSRSLLERLRNRARSLAPLQQRIDERTGKTQEEQEARLRELDESRLLDAARRVADRIGTDLPTDVQKHLRWMEDHLGSGRNGVSYRLRSALVEAQAAAEMLLLGALRNADALLVAATLSEASRQEKQYRMDRMASSIGLQTPIPQGISVQTPGPLACRGKSGSLRAHVAAAICAATHSVDHPLRAAAAAEPALPQLLDRVAQLRNEYGGHSGAPPSGDDAREAADNVYRACEALLPHL